MSTPNHLFKTIRPGDRVTFRNAHDQIVSGPAVIVNRPDAVVVVNMGGKYGRPGICTAWNLVSVSPARVPHPAEWALIINDRS